MEVRPGAARVFSRKYGPVRVWHYDYRSSNGMLRITGSHPTWAEAMRAALGVFQRGLRG